MAYSNHTFDNTKMVMNDLCQRSQAVGGARGIGDDMHSTMIIRVIIHSHYKEWCHFILCRSYVVYVSYAKESV